MHSPLCVAVELTGNGGNPTSDWNCKYSAVAQAQCDNPRNLIPLCENEAHQRNVSVDSVPEDPQTVLVLCLNSEVVDVLEHWEH